MLFAERPFRASVQGRRVILWIATLAIWATGTTSEIARAGGDHAGRQTGACCLPPPTWSCLETTEADCVNQSGAYAGDGTSCDDEILMGCEPRACCPDEGCVYLSQPACIAAEGSFIGGPPYYLTCDNDPCSFGVCCIMPGWCEEDIPPEDCLWYPDQWYVYGVTCDADPEPCPVCEFANNANCKEDGPGSVFWLSDRNRGARVADDFRPDGSVIERICWSAAFYHPDGECAGDPPPDNWLVSIYADDGTGVPDEDNPVVSETSIFIDAKFRRGSTSRVWDYAGWIDPVTVNAGECYWLEITGQGIDTCNTYWVTSSEGNQHSMWDIANYGEYEPLDVHPHDFTFCLDSGLDGETDCGLYLRACCRCAAGCEIATQSDCVGYSPPGGFLFAETSCDPDPCPGIPANNDCVNAEVIPTVIHAGPWGVDVEFNNICATDDGPELGCGGGHFHFDTWFYYEAESLGILTVTLCGRASYDSILAFYDGTGFAANPDDVCPVSHEDELDGCNPPGSSNDCCANDTCNIDAGPSELSMYVCPGQEILVRVGGWYDESTGTSDGKGWGTVNFWLIAPG